MSNEYNLLTDFYFFKVSYVQFLKGDSKKNVLYEYYFRKNPFNLNYTIFCGLSDLIKILKNFEFTNSDLKFIQESLEIEKNDPFLNILKEFKFSNISINSVDEGTIVFPYNPVLTLEGPLIWLTLLEGLILNTINFPSLISTYASLLKLKANNKPVFEFGLRRAQGNNGALTASKYSYIGGIDASSNVLFTKKYNLKPIGTMSHSYIMSFNSIKNLDFILNFPSKLKIKNEELKEILEKIIDLNNFNNTNISELISFICFFMTYPNNFISLIDTYDVDKSGIPNFIIVALAAYKLGYYKFGVRFDSGDFYAQSLNFKNILKSIDLKNNSELFNYSKICISNDIDEKVIEELESKKDNCIDIYAVGTNLVTCKKQPALGMVGKLIEFDGFSCLKFNEDKLMFPFKKLLNKCLIKNNNEYVYILSLENENLFNMKEFFNFNKKEILILDIKTIEILNLNFKKIDWNINKIRQRVIDQHKSMENFIKLNEKMPLIFSINYYHKYLKLKNDILK